MSQQAREWRVVIEDSVETESSVIAFGTRNDEPVVLKVVRRMSDEWCSGEILKAFDGHGCARVYEWAPGVVLLERLRPGHSLVDLTLNGRDEEATDILAEVIQRMSARSSSMSQVELPQRCATVFDWGQAFERYVATGDDQIPADLVAEGQQLYSRLCASQVNPILLHGDLQHYNVLFDARRGWLAIDPKGVVSEVEYEVGAFLRNPFERPELFLSCPRIERRVTLFANKLKLNYERMLGWGFAQAILSAIWMIEDGFAVNATNPALRLAHVIRPMLS
jgi:streptomycin 6-kinase